MPLFDADAYLRHAIKTTKEITKLILEGRPVALTDYRDDEPDILAGRPREWIDVKTLREETKTLTISQRQFEKHASEYSDLIYAIWADDGRLALSTDQLLDRAIAYRGGSIHEGKSGRPPYYLFDVSGDSFVNPFARERKSRGPNVEHDAQISFDQRAVAKVTPAPLGERQQLVLEALKLTPLKAYEIGTWLHAAKGHCNDSPSRRDVDRALRTGECCIGAVDDGGKMVTSLKERGLIWKDESSFWHLYPEDISSWAA